MTSGGEADPPSVCPEVWAPSHALPNPNALLSTVREAKYETESLHLGSPGANPEQVGTKCSSASVPTLSFRPESLSRSLASPCISRCPYRMLER